MDINIEEVPATSEKLEMLRANLLQELNIIKNRARLFYPVAYFMVALDFIFSINLWQTDVVDGIWVLPMFMCVFFALGMIKSALDRYIKDPMMKVKSKLSDLVELDANSPDESIEFDRWRGEDETIKVLNKIVDSGRKPTMGEYRAVMAWLESKDKMLSPEDKMEKVNDACSRMTQRV